MLVPFNLSLVKINAKVKAITLIDKTETIAKRAVNQNASQKDAS